jgi:cytidylate kinase
MRTIGRIVDEQIKGWERERTHGGKETTTHRFTPICLSRDVGCGGRVIARILAEKLDYKLFGRDTIDHIAKDLHTQRRLVDLLDEHGKSGLERWVDGYLHGAPVEYDEYGRSLVKVVRSASLQGDVILLGRGANFILGLEESFCVRVVAPKDRRIAQLMKYESIGRQEAEALIEETDSERAAFIKRVFHRDINDPLNYHLTLNLTDMDFETAVGIILETMKQEGFLRQKKAVPIK